MSEEHKEKLNTQAQCYRLGVMSSMALKSSEEALESGKKEVAKQELLGVLDILDESCLGNELCNKIKASINKAVISIDGGKDVEAKEAMSNIITLSFNNGEKVEPNKE